MDNSISRCSRTDYTLSWTLTNRGRALRYSHNVGEYEFCELRLNGVLGNSREIDYSIDKGGPTSSIPCELKALLRSSRSGLLPNFASSSKNASIWPAGCKAPINLPVPSPTCAHTCATFLAASSESPGPNS
jgi:hypothetical protein